MTPLRVAMVTPRYAPDLGGVETHVRAVATGLAARGHQVTVLTQADAGTLARAGRHDRADGVTVRRHRLLLSAAPDVPAPGLLAGLRRALARADVVHAHSYHALPALGVALAPGRTPFVLTPHYHGTGHTPARARLHRAYRPLGSLLVRRADALVAVSRAERDLLGESFGPRVLDRTEVIPNGVVRPPLGDPFPVAGPVVLTVGRLEPYKRVDLLVRCLTRLPPEVRLVVVGDGPARADLAALARGLSLESRVLLLGRVDDADLARWRATASAFATASAHEAFGIGLAEGLAAGLPSVASGIPAHREVAAGAAHAVLVPAPVVTTPGASPDSDLAAVEAFAEALRGVLAQGRATRPSRSPFWSWDAVTTATEEVYRRVLADRVAARREAA